MRPFHCPLCGAWVPAGEQTVEHVRTVHPDVQIVAQDMSVDRGMVFELDPEQINGMGFEMFPGYPTAFTRRQVPGAMPNGTRIVKVFAETKDTRPAGAEGVVLGSLAHPNPKMGLAYFVEWDSRPKCAVLVMAAKIQPAQLH